MGMNTAQALLWVLKNNKVTGRENKQTVCHALQRVRMQNLLTQAMPFRSHDDVSEKIVSFLFTSTKSENQSAALVRAEEPQVPRA